MLLFSTPGIDSTLRYRYAVLFIASVFITSLIQGCTSAPNKSEDPKRETEATTFTDARPVGIRTIAVVPSSTLPVVDLEGIFGNERNIAMGAVTGAAGGIGAFFVSCIFTAGLCVAFAPLILGSALVGGAVVGGEMAAEEGASRVWATPEANEAYLLERNQATSNISSLDIQTALALIVGKAAEHETEHRFVNSKLVERKPAQHQSLSERGVDTVIEVGLSTIGIDKADYLRIRGKARVMTLPGGNIKDTHDFEFVFLESLFVDSESAEDWIVNRGKSIHSALARTLPPMGYRLAEEILVLHPVNFEAQLHPHLNAVPQPKLVWNVEQFSRREPWLTFSRDYSVELAVVDAPKGNICLDWLLRETGTPRQIVDPHNGNQWQVVRSPCLLETPEQLVYRRKGLKTNSHQLETNLVPCTDYAWSVRAEFPVEDQIRRSEWAPWARLTTRCDLPGRD